MLMDVVNVLFLNPVQKKYGLSEIPKGFDGTFRPMPNQFDCQVQHSCKTDRGANEYSEDCQHCLQKLYVF